MQLQGCRRTMYERQSALGGFLHSLPPTEHPQGPERIPPAGLADLLQFEERLAGMPILQDPSTIRAALPQHHADWIFEALIISCLACPKVVERPQNVVMPAGRKRKPRERRIDDVVGAMGTVKAMNQKELTSASLGPHHHRR